MREISRSGSEAPSDSASLKSSSAKKRKRNAIFGAKRRKLKAPASKDSSLLTADEGDTSTCDAPGDEGTGDVTMENEESNTSQNSRPDDINDREKSGLGAREEDTDISNCDNNESNQVDNDTLAPSENCAPEEQTFSESTEHDPGDKSKETEPLHSRETNPNDGVSEKDQKSNACQEHEEKSVETVALESNSNLGVGCVDKVSLQSSSDNMEDGNANPLKNANLSSDEGTVVNANIEVKEASASRPKNCDNENNSNSAIQPSAIEADKSLSASSDTDSNVNNNCNPTVCQSPTPVPSTYEPVQISVSKCNGDSGFLSYQYDDSKLKQERIEDSGQERKEDSEQAENSEQERKEDFEQKSKTLSQEIKVENATPKSEICDIKVESEIGEEGKLDNMKNETIKTDNGVNNDVKDEAIKEETMEVKEEKDENNGANEDEESEDEGVSFF